MTEVLWANLRAPELSELARRNAIVMVPVGSMEQHGPHLPVQVDSLLATEICVRAARLVQDREPVVVAPTVWCGLAEHHMDFGGTMTLDFDTFRGVLRCICQSLVRQGFRRIMLLNGHGGNVSALNVIAGDIGRELEAPVFAATYCYVAGTAQRYKDILEQQENVRHACEAESSMVLALLPELVDRESMAHTQGTMTNMVGPSGAYRFRSFAELTETGVNGVPALATAEKGELLLDAAAEELAETLLGDELW